MKDAMPIEGKLIPPTLNKSAANSNKGPKQTPQETEHTPASQDKSPPKKKKAPSKPSTLESVNVFEATTADAGRDFSMLFSKVADLLSERAAADTSQMKELEGILTEAHNMQTYLKEKKRHLRQTLDIISDKLQG